MYGDDGVWPGNEIERNTSLDRTTRGRGKIRRLHRLRRFRSDIGLRCETKKSALTRKDMFNSRSVAKPQAEICVICGSYLLSLPAVLIHGHGASYG
jgi:hypothetical protein